MPRNPNKTRCYYPHCKNWAMRGRTLCRAHRQFEPDAKLEKGKGGAPRNNLNALKTGRHTHPASPPDLDELVRKIIYRPDEFPLAVGLAVQSIHERTQDPLSRILGLFRLVQELVPLVTNQLISIEVKNLLGFFPPEKQASTGSILQKHCAHLNALEQLRFIRGIKKDLFPLEEMILTTGLEPGELFNNRKRRDNQWPE
ncbi:MAG: hypothetical protein JXA42_11840 [Anaerolineales bacterium]|nr:hypothetical protein [Anaerolineales bacterium]